MNQRNTPQGLLTSLQTLFVTVVTLLMVVVTCPITFSTCVSGGTVGDRVGGSVPSTSFTIWLTILLALEVIPVTVSPERNC